MWFCNSSIWNSETTIWILSFKLKHIWILKLNGKLFRFTGEGTYICGIRNNFFKKADTLNPLASAVQGLWSGFSIFLVIFQNYKLMKIISTNTNNKHKWIQGPSEFFVMIVNSIAKSPILDVPGVSNYIIVTICFWLQCRCTSLTTWNF